MTVIAPPTPASRDIANVTTDIETRLKRVESGLRTVQLNNSSVNGAIDLYDNSGKYRGSWGVSPDGAVGFLDTNNPIPPPIPSAPILTPDIVSVIVGHPGDSASGVQWPPDATHFNVYHKPVMSTEPPILGGTITPIINGAGSTCVIGPLEAIEHEFWLTSVNLSGKESQPGAIATATPNLVVGEETLAEIIADLQTNEGIVTEAMLAASAVTETKIAPDSISSPLVKAGAIQAVNIGANQINGGHIVGASITGAHIRALAITSDKIDVNTINAGHIRTGAVTALKLEANMVLASRIICGTATGNRVELHPTLGIVGYTGNGAQRTFWIDSTTGNVTAIGQWSTGFSGERVIIDTDGTCTFVDANNVVSGKIINDGTNGIYFRSRWDGGSTDASFIFLSRINCFIAYGRPGRFVASFACDGAGIQSWGRLVGIRYEQRFSGDGTQPRLFILGTETDGSDSGLSTLHFIKRGSPGNREPVIFATGQNAGLLFEDSYVVACRNNGFAVGGFIGTEFLISSSEEVKEELNPPTLGDDRTELDVIEGAPTFGFYYKDDKEPPDVAIDQDGNPVMARVRNDKVPFGQWKDLPEDHPDKWKFVHTPLPHLKNKYSRRQHRFPTVEDLAAIDPALAVGDTVDLRDMIGILWGAMDKMIKRQRILEGRLAQRMPNLNLPPRPQKGDLTEGIGAIVSGRSRRQIDPTTGQAKHRDQQ
jgi:hypothetical protein